MNDVNGIELKVGDRVGFSSYDFGYIKLGKVIAVTEKNVKIEHIRYADVLGVTTKRQPNFIIKVREIENG